MPKIRKAEKWVAWLERPFNNDAKSIRTLKIEVLESDKQFRIEGDDATYRQATAACGYKRVINKSSNDCLFDSEIAALRQLERYYKRHSPDESKIKELLLQCIEEHYGSLAGIIVTDDRYANAIRQIQEIVGKF